MFVFPLINLNELEKFTETFPLKLRLNSKGSNALNWKSWETVCFMRLFLLVSYQINLRFSNIS